MTKFTYVKVHKRSVGKRCMHCGRPATVTALRVSPRSKFKLNVRYCQVHAEELGATKGDDS